ncbi:YjfA family protein [Shimazuella sp. AN120528]|uniref:DUF2690 domain-containing protein n=1 Tax=Shimazuella soli TaxID=1892854 RepID=UPI001F1081E1|nr:DUF2690 domain-containing protein [Shimazuella soli]MCH5584688.1 YjfA family protein [Shimazuella soli]
MWHKLRISMLVSIVSVLGLFVSIHSVSAANYYYDGKSPVATGCNNTGWSPKSTTFSYNGISGTVYLMFSSSCKTAWAFVKLNKALPKGYNVQGWINRTKDQKIMGCSTSGGNGDILPGQTTCYSGMVYDLNPNTSHASVQIIKPNACGPNCHIFEYSKYTGSY